MDSKIAARMIAVLALGAAMTAAVMALRGDGTEDAAPHSLRRPGGEPAIAELVRCRDLGMAAANDPICRKAWAENRRRFLQSREPERSVTPKPERPATPRAERFGDGEAGKPKATVPPINLPVSP
ncbi:putative entry exclusion protein TrbK-alt [Aminobacter aganoensis]|uniref:Conjugative transfer region protein TrbK n=1 Tax=Aminobacter aganoensis TaxID=83264 RepID=A0A7X0FCN3_9HYPH|nr:putative entry exclusion protein TrbK-alt [Aminobacter aganoensis]MBB6357230.1 conjugative transfer region protein TrbK [Aminobacter aganoensis]